MQASQAPEEPPTYQPEPKTLSTDSIQPSEHKRPAMFRSLRYRNFKLFFCGQLISLIGTWMQGVAEAWLVYRLTNSSVLLGLAGFAAQIPVLIIAPISGTIVDRHSRHKLIIATQTCAMILAGALAVLTLTGLIRVWEIFALAVMLGVVYAFDIPGRQSFLVEMVGKEDLINAIALNSSVFNGARVVGPAVAGLLVAAIGEGWCFFSNAVSYIAVIIGLLMMKDLPQLERQQSGSTVENIREGFGFVGRTPPILALMLLLALVSLMGMPYSVLMPIFAADILHGSASTLGFLMGCAGVGALIGALTLAARQEVRGLGRWVGWAAISFGFTLILFSFSKRIWLSAGLLVPIGFSIMVQMAASNTLLQSMAPDRLRGRVMAVYSMMFMGGAPLGSLMAGALASHIGAPYTVAFGGSVCIIGGTVFLSRLPALRVTAHRLIVASALVSGEPAAEMTAGSAIAVDDVSDESAQIAE